MLRLAVGLAARIIAVMMNFGGVAFVRVRPATEQGPAMPVLPSPEREVSSRRGTPLRSRRALRLCIQLAD